MNKRNKKAVFLIPLILTLASCEFTFDLSSYFSYEDSFGSESSLSEESSILLDPPSIIESSSSSKESSSEQPSSESNSSSSSQSSFESSSSCYTSVHYSADYIPEYTLGKDNIRSFTNGDNLSAFYTAVHNQLSEIYITGSTETLTSVQFDIDSANVGFYEAVNIVHRVRLDNPLYYFLGSDFSYDGGTGILSVNVPIEYSLKEDRLRIQDEVAQFIVDSGISSNDSDFVKVFKAHDYIINRIDYEYVGNSASQEEHAHNIVGLVEETGAVCEGYAKAFQLLCNYFNVPSYFVSGKTNSGEGHAWNLVHVDSEWYWCDLTWDDQDTSGITQWYSSTQGGVWDYRTAYFLRNDENFITTHIQDTNTFKEDGSFMYIVPSRAAENYFESHDTKLYDYFEIDGFTYQIIGYNTLTVAYIEKIGHASIPATVSYEDCLYTVISIGTYFTGDLPVNDYMLMSFNNSSRVVVDSTVSSLYIPETIITIYQHALTSNSGIGDVEPYFQNYLEQIDVAFNNPYFCSIDGVLYTKDLSFIVAYPFSKNVDFYEINSETINGDTNVFCGLSNLKELKIGANYSRYLIFQASAYLGLNNGKLIIDSSNPYFYTFDGVIYSTPDCLSGESGTARIMGFTDVNQTSYTLLGTIISGGKTYTVNSFYLHGCQGEKDGHAYGISGSVFDYILKAENFNIQNDMFHMYGDCLCYYNEIIYIRKDKSEITIGKEIVDIQRGDFSNQNNIEKVVIESGIESIGDIAFYGCSKLSEIYIPSTVTKIGNRPFYMCYELSDIHYDGSLEQWIELAPSSCFEETKINYQENIYIHCSDGTFVASYN